MKEADGGEGLQYLRGWAAVTEMMRQGKSWSGSERNNCYLNLGNGRFVEGSFVAGLDFADDGRAVAVTDWDGDGDLDLWLRNRTGPQLRYMRNDRAPDRHFVELRLVGTLCNRDAIGAAVEVDAGGRRLLRSLAAGDGYLSQSSRRLHFGLGAETAIERVVVRWPGGAAEEIAGVVADHRYEIRQGAGVAHETKAPAAGSSGSAGTGTSVRNPAAIASAGRVLLRVPLPLPPSLKALVHESPAPPDKEPDKEERKAPAVLVTFWAQWCAPCLDELEELAAGARGLAQSGLRVVALDVDAPEDRAKAMAWFEERVGSLDGAGVIESAFLDASEMDTVEALLRHVLAREGEMILPTSFLVDTTGSIEMLYLGRAPVGELGADVAKWVFSDHPEHRRTLTTGRWYFRTPRALEGLAADLTSRGRVRDAAFYRSLVPAPGIAGSAPPPR